MTKRVKFDFEIDFTNGGGIQGQDFRLDIEGNTISDKELADYIIQDMRLLMVGQVRILNKEIISEAHKRQPINPAMDSSYIDLSHIIYDGLITYKGLPAPIVCDYLSREESRSRYAPGTEFQIGKIEMVTNTGTYVDCPFHRYEDGKDLSEVELESFVDLDGIIIRADHRSGLAVTAEDFKGKELRGRAVLVHTGWDSHWATDSYFEKHPFLTEEAAVYLRDCGVKLVGIDSMNIDDTRGNARPVHSTLLKAEILIAEHLCNLANVPDEGFTFTAVPPKFKGAGTFPVRAFARIK
ncbi:MAG: cyclase family protein [Anaerolineales bacterium]|nr:cyclase family protein [Anaerolineales bacterium]